MKLSVVKMCRGRGIAYYLVKAHTANRLDLFFEARSESGRSLPIAAYRLDRCSGSGEFYVLSTPLLDTRKVIVRATNRESGERSNDITIGRFVTKWRSRLNYKLTPAIAYSLRDIDRRTYSGQIHINLLSYSVVQSKKEILVKGVICSPFVTGKDNDTLVEVLASDGSVVVDPNLYIYKSESTMYEGLSRAKTPFTLRLPDDGRTYCIVASGQGCCRSGYLCLDSASKQVYEGNYGSGYYRLAKPGAWDAEMRAHDDRYSLASRDDYDFSFGPKFSIVVPLYHTPVDYFNSMVRSVTSQLYTNWELLLINSTPEDEGLAKAIRAIDDDRIKVITLESNLGISGNTNVGIDAACGDFIVFFDHDDVMDRVVLSRYATEICREDVDALYCDEDLLMENGKYASPHFKSDLNLDLLRCHNYITHLLCVRSSYAKKLRLRNDYDGAQDYDFILRLVEETSKIVHIPDVLYHWRVSKSSTSGGLQAKPYAQTAGRKALEQHLLRQGLPATVQDTDIPFLYRTEYQVAGDPLVSILIPNKDSKEVLSRCLESIYEKTRYRNFEIIVIENNSVEDDTFEYYQQALECYENLSVVKWDDEFNYSAINNYGASFAAGEYLLLLNNDIEVISPDWIDSMLGFCQREDVGVVGTKLLYPDGTIQHAGVAMSYCEGPHQTGGPVHVFANLDDTDPGYVYRTLFSQDVSMVTGACLMTKRKVFDSLGGLNERYKVAYNDVDYCLRVRRENLLVVYDANVKLWHYESFSRGSDTQGEKARRFVSEQGKLRADWPGCFVDPDPYYGRRLNA